MRNAIETFWAGSLRQSQSMFGDGPTEAERAARRRVALRAVDVLAARHRRAVWDAMERGAGLTEAHEAAAGIARQAFEELRGVGITGGQATQAWCSATGRA